MTHKTFVIIISLSFTAIDSQADVRIGRTKESERPSIQQECPDAYFWDSSNREYEQYFYPLRNRTWTRDQLNNALNEMVKCLDPATGPYFKLIWDKKDTQPYSSILLDSANREWICRTNQPGLLDGRPSLLSERATLEVYQCHKRAGWPTAIDYAPLAPKPVAVPGAAAPLKAEFKAAPSSAASPADHMRHCKNEAYVQGVKDDERRAFMTACINIATSKRHSNGLNQDASNTLSPNHASAKKKAAQTAHKCVSVKQGSMHNTGISTETATLLNACNEKVSYLYCVDSSNGGGHFSCRGQNFGAGDIKARGSDVISVISANNPLRIHWFACTDGDGSLTHHTVRYENGAIRGTCR